MKVYAQSNDESKPVSLRSRDDIVCKWLWLSTNDVNLEGALLTKVLQPIRSSVDRRDWTIPALIVGNSIGRGYFVESPVGVETLRQEAKYSGLGYIRTMFLPPKHR